MDRKSDCSLHSRPVGFQFASCIPFESRYLQRSETKNLMIFTWTNHRQLTILAVLIDMFGIHQSHHVKEGLFNLGEDVM